MDTEKILTLIKEIEDELKNNKLEFDRELLELKILASEMVDYRDDNANEEA